jgi:ankyrin repeat protein
LEHQQLALQATFTEDQVKYVRISYQSTLSDEELARIGIVQGNSEGKPQFIHRTFAEYFVVEFLIKQLTKETEQHKKVQDFLLNKILLQTDCEVIRAFLDGLLKETQQSVEVLEGFGEKLDKQWKDRAVPGPVRDDKTALHQAAAENNVHIVGFLLDSLKSEEHTTAIRKMLLATDDDGRTALNLAVRNDSAQALKRYGKGLKQ